MASPLAAAVLLAHQGGWDEMLMVAAPIIVFALILRTANKRAERRAAEATGGTQDTEPATDEVP